MSKTIIKVENLGKQYRLGERGPAYGTLRDSVMNIFKHNPRKDHPFIWALKDVGFEVKQGEIVGVIGRNGAGKSTLLKILSRITEPTQGRAEIHGRVGSLLEVGTGFHGELTGRENLYLNGAILGMKKKEIDRKFDEIIAFSELEKFIDTPVKFYSSGMYIRLGFAVAAHLETEILLIDEVLAIGDVAFQQKCLGKVNAVAKGGRTIFFVSHNMGAVKNLCQRALYVDQGKVVLDANTDKAIALYLDQNLVEGAVASFDVCQKRVEGTSKEPQLRFHEVKIHRDNGQMSNMFISDENVNVSVTYECLAPVSHLRLVMQVVDENNSPIITSQNLDAATELAFIKKEAGMYHSTCTIPANLLGESHFFISVNMSSQLTELFVLNKILKFDIRFKGYNNTQDDYAKSSWLRPLLPWKTEHLEKR